MLKTIKKQYIKHGLTKHPLYHTWGLIIQRCYNKNNTRHKDYGGQGINVCDEWRYDFKAFYDWSISNGYSLYLTIDRIDNNGNYEPSNCRWTTKSVQQRNTRKIMSTNTSGYRGVAWYKRDNKWRAYICVNKKRIHLGYFYTSLEAAQAYDNYVITNNLEHTKNFDIIQ